MSVSSVAACDTSFFVRYTNGTAITRMPWGATEEFPDNKMMSPVGTEVGFVANNGSAYLGMFGYSKFKDTDRYNRTGRRNFRDEPKGVRFDGVKSIVSTKRCWSTISNNGAIDSHGGTCVDTIENVKHDLEHGGNVMLFSTSQDFFVLRRDGKVITWTDDETRKRDDDRTSFESMTTARGCNGNRTQNVRNR